MQQNMDFTHYLTDNARGSLQHAENIARSAGSAYVGTEHLLLGVLSQETSIGAKLLTDAGITLDRARMALNLTPRSLVVSTGMKGMSETAKLTLRMSWEIAQEFHQDYCGTEHILFSILNQKNARASVLLRDMKVDTTDLLAEIESYLGRQREYEMNSDTQQDSAGESKKGVLGAFGTDLTARSKAGELDPVIGRDEQIERMITILSRRTKNNPVLIGEPGVGKTAIVEGLAHRIAQEEVPEHLLDRRVIQLDIAGMLSGTKYRGEFEQRIKHLMHELSQDTKSIIFIDELHLLVGAGAAEGAMDAANMLKPALARGTVRLIGATTLDEYRKHIEKDTALERRLQQITVPEPSTKDAVNIIKGLRHHYETYHGVTMSDDVIDEAVRLADRYISERYMPDKAIDVIDEAAARTRISNATAQPKAVREAQQQLKYFSSRMEEAVASENYERAAMYKTRISQAKEKIATLQQDETTKEAVALTIDDVAAAIATMTGIPVQRIAKNEQKLLRSLEKHLGKHIIGQDEAIHSVARAIRRSRSGIAHARRPIGSFVFMGPTGVGKTELARVLASEVFGSQDALIKIDMSEFGDKHTASRLVGAPAGYVGYDESNQLTDKVRRRPYSVVLFDEIEKAHPDIFQLLLQLLEDGRLTDAKGRHVDFSNTIIILTSNVGASDMYKESELGFGLTKSTRKTDAELQRLHEQNAKSAHQALERIMKPELIGRFDSVVTFRALTRPQVGKIFDLHLDAMRERLATQGLGLLVSPAAKRWLLDKGYDAKKGIRPLRRTLENELEHGIAEGLLNGDFRKGDVITAGVSRGKIVLDVKAE